MRDEPLEAPPRMGGEVLPGTMVDGDGNTVTLCGFGGCPQVWNHKGRCEVPILDSRRRAPRAPARLDDSPERHQPEERAEGDGGSAAAHHGMSEDWAPKHENENTRLVELQPAPEQSMETRPDAQPAPEQAPAAVDARPDTQPAPELAPVTLDALPDDSQLSPEPTPLPTPTPLGCPTSRPTSEAAPGRGEETPAPTLVPSMSPPESVTRREEMVTEVEVDGALMQLYLSRQSSTGNAAVAHVAAPGEPPRRPFMASAARPLGLAAGRVAARGVTVARAPSEPASFARASFWVMLPLGCPLAALWLPLAATRPAGAKKEALLGHRLLLSLPPLPHLLAHSGTQATAASSTALGRGRSATGRTRPRPPRRRCA